MTRKEVLERIDECEKKGVFDEHVDPISPETAIKVDESFKYIKKGFEAFRYFIITLFIVTPFTFYINKIRHHVKVVGKKNLKHIKGAIVTCNHVDKFDCLCIKRSLRPHKTYIIGASFNNQPGFWGEMMRVGGMLPLSENFQAMKNFNRTIENLLTKKNNFVVVYPEQSMWWHYSKPRPFKNGAFHFAAKYDVPVVPLFITYIETKKLDDEGIPIKKFVLNIMPPIYRNKELSIKENIELMRNKNYELCKNKYEEFYKIPLVFNIKSDKQQNN